MVIGRKRKALVCADIIGALKGAMSPRARSGLERRGLRQKDVKLLVVRMVDALVAKAHPRDKTGPRHWLCANRCGEMRKLQARHSPYESMVDVAAYAGDVDPYRTLMTAESEASPVHRLGPRSQSGNNDYLWDLWKLLQVPSPLRLFVALVRDRIKLRKGRCQLLERHVARMICEYAENGLFNKGDRLFSLILPTGSSKKYESVCCRGWIITARGAVLLPNANWA
jgi:hypothetical protein